MALPEPATSEELMTIGGMLEESVNKMNGSLNDKFDTQISLLREQNSLTSSIVNNTKVDKFAAKEAGLEAGRIDPIEPEGGATMSDMAGSVVVQPEEEDDGNLIGKVVGFLAAAGGLVLFKKLFETGGWIDQAKGFLDDTEKDAGLETGMGADADRAAQAEELTAKISEAMEAGDTEAMQGLQAKLDNLVAIQEAAAAQTEDTVGFFRDKVERDALKSSEETLQKLKALQESNKTLVDDAAQRDEQRGATERFQGPKQGRSETPAALKPRQRGESREEYQARLEGYEKPKAEATEPTPMAEPRAEAEPTTPVATPTPATAAPAAAAKPAAEPVSTPASLPEGVTKDPITGKYRSTAYNVEKDGYYSKLHDTPEEAVKYIDDGMKGANEYMKGLEADFDAHLDEQGFGPVQADGTRTKEPGSVLAPEQAGIEPSASGKGGQVQAMSENAAGAQTPVIINNVKQGDSNNVTNNNVAMGGGAGRTNARPNAGSSHIGYKKPPVRRPGVPLLGGKETPGVISLRLQAVQRMIDHHHLQLQS